MLDAILFYKFLTSTRDASFKVYNLNILIVFVLAEKLLDILLSL